MNRNLQIKKLYKDLFQLKKNNNHKISSNIVSKLKTNVLYLRSRLKNWKRAEVAQLARARDSYSRGRRFEPASRYIKNLHSNPVEVFILPAYYFFL